MKKFVIFLYILLVAIALPSSAQKTTNDSINLWSINVVDGFYEKSISNAKVSVYEADSVTMLCDSLPKLFRTYDGTFLSYKGRLPLRSKYVFHVECKGYTDAWVSCKVKKTWYGKYPAGFYAPTVKLFEEHNYDLGEASVTASRIQFVVKGDTIEYNAAAFRLSEGSMLDNLVRALPGAKLDDNGRIMVNGKFVKKLTINGRDFFNNDPKVALSNLPAYTVNKIRVFHDRPFNPQDDLRSAIEKESDPLVMDVRLKREYAEGWISNYELAGGSNLKGGWDEKWLARLFAMRYTNHSSLAIYANVNNLNDASSPASKGEWRATEPSAGEKKTYMAGVNFSIAPQNNKIRFNTSAQAQRQEVLTQVRTNDETYYSSGNVYNRAHSSGRTNTTDLTLNSTLAYSNITFNQNAYYKHNKVRSTDKSAQLQSVSATDIDTLYSRTNNAFQREDKWGVSFDIANQWNGIKLGEKFGRLYYKGSFAYNKTDHASEWWDMLQYRDASLSGNNLAEGRQATQPKYDYNYRLGGDYNAPYLYKKDKTQLQFKLNYAYVQTFNSGQQDLVRCDNSLTPSANDAIEWAIDEQNSFHTTRLERVNQLTPRLTFAVKKFRADFFSELVAQRRRINDYRDNKESRFVDRHLNYNPSLYLTLGNMTNGEGKQIAFEGSIRNTLPNLLDLLDVRDGTDPLVKYYGNSRLKVQREYQTALRLDMQTHKPAWRYYYLRLRYNKWNNSVSRAREYDRATGITIFQPKNVNGNWSSKLTGGFELGDVPKGLRWDYFCSFTYQHSNEFATDVTLPDNSIHSVNSLIQEHELTLTYSINKVRLAFRGNANWTQMRSEQHLFSKFSYTDFNYGLSFSSPLAWGIDFETDIMAYYRRGYNDASMNTTNWVWNAQLSKAFGKRKQWLAKACGFDILHQISTVRRTVNAQGRTETWYNTIPSYAILSVAYRLDVKPKKGSK